MPESGTIPGLVIALMALIGVVYQARVGWRTSDRAGFREDFTALVKELKEQNAELDDKLEVAARKLNEATVKIDEMAGELRALGRYTRVVIGAAEDAGAVIPVYTPPPDLSKHLV
ncbi:hypothetical protein [Embleya sp. NPDC005971]|uniref:hypothetical protein n=1 Tax=Embleya sp. NPDC005971 TaxID=3156724 RepID=UPI0033DF7379